MDREISGIVEGISRSRRCNHSDGESTLTPLKMIVVVPK